MGVSHMTGSLRMLMGFGGALGPFPALAHPNAPQRRWIPSSTALGPCPLEAVQKVYFVFRSKRAEGVRTRSRTPWAHSVRDLTCPYIKHVPPAYRHPKGEHFQGNLGQSGQAKGRGCAESVLVGIAVILRQL